MTENDRMTHQRASDRDILTDLARNVISAARLYGLDSELSSPRKPTKKEGQA